jgi:hypothetical protein
MTATMQVRSIELLLSEPVELAQVPPADWLAGSIIGVHSFRGGADSEAIAIRLEHPLVWRGRSYPLVVVTSREGQGLLDGLPGHGGLECSFIGVVDDGVLEGEAIGRQLDSWRGGLAGIATVRPQ